jgi:two-component system, cell cycle sensor histidine kinase and response regulator CckA
MNSETFMGMVNNAALLLALAVLYDILPLKKSARHWVWGILTGVLIGLIGMAVMLTPWHFSEGVIFDTCSILLSLTGLFFGLIPTLIAALMTGVLRIFQGGVGTLMGVSVILTSAGLGLAWRYILRSKNRSPGWVEFYGFGVIVHIAMLLWIFALPREINFIVLKQISLPVILIYPVGTVLLGLLLTRQRQRNEWELALRQERDLLARTFETSLDAILLTTPDGSIDAANPAACQMFGRSEAEIIEVGRNGIVDVSDPRLSLALEERARTGRFSSELEFIRKDGQKFPGEVASALFKDHEGRDRLSMIIRDITDRKHAEEALHESEKRFRALIENSSDAITLLDAKGIAVYDSPAAPGMLGYTPEDWIGRDVFALLHPDDAPKTRKLFQNLIETPGSRVGSIFRVRHKSGSWLWIEMVATNLLSEPGVKAIVLNYRDITGRRQAEEALLASQQIIEGIINAIPVRVFWKDKNLVYLGCNVEFARDAGFAEPKDIIGKDDYQMGWRDQAELYRGDDRKVIESGSSKFHVEEPQTTPEGNIITLLTSKAPLRNSKGEIVGVLGTYMDITERKQAEEEIRQLNATLEKRIEERTRELREAQEKLMRQEKLAVLGQLAGGVGHELRNPLGIINNAIYYLRMVQPDADETVKEYLGIIETETRTADKIISDLLDFSRIKSVEVEPVTVSDLVGRTLERFPVPENVQVTLNLPENLPTVYIDPRQMTQVLGNLVLNACQAMPKGGEITLSAKKKGKMVAIAVADTGNGITPENMKKLFEPLFTTKPKGIGLGLAVSKKLVEANGGKIEVESEPGKGSTFTLWLPVKP